MDVHAFKLDLAGHLLEDAQKVSATYLVYGSSIVASIAKSSDHCRGPASVGKRGREITELILEVGTDSDVISTD